MKTTLNITILGTALLFLLSGCDDDAPVESHVRNTPAPRVSVSETSATELLAMEFPPELLEGTKKPMPVPNLMPLLKKDPVVRVPEGTQLLSQGKPVASSDDYPIIGTLDLVTDGDKEAGQGYYVDLEDGLQWVQIDLETSAEIRVVWIWHDHSQRKATHDVIVQVSDDPEFNSGVITVFNNDYDDSAGFGIGRDRPYVESRFGKPVDAKGARGRYVRLYSCGNTYETANRYIEVEVYGRRDDARKLHVQTPR